MAGDAMTQPAKLDFNTVFDDLAERPFGMSEEKERTWSETEVEQEKAIAFAKGSESGRTEALATIEQKLSQAVDRLLVQSAEITNSLSAVESRLVGEAKQLALTVGQTVASELLVQSGRQEIEAIVGESLALLTHQPHVVVRVHEELLEGLKSRLEAIAEQRGFTGKLIMLGEPDLDRSDCRIEWAEGGIARDLAALQARIETIVAHHLSTTSASTEQHDLFSYASDPATPLPAEPEETKT